MQLRLSKKILFYIFLIIFLSNFNNKYFLKIGLKPIDEITVIGLNEREMQDLLSNLELHNLKNIFFLNKFELEEKLKATNYFNLNSKEFDSLFIRAKKEVKKQLSNCASSHNRLLYFQKLFEIKGLGPQVYHALDLEQTYWNSFLIQMELREGVLEFLE